MCLHYYQVLCCCTVTNDYVGGPPIKISPGEGRGAESLHLTTSGGSSICQRGEADQREPKRGSGAEPPAEARGRAPGGGRVRGTKPPEAESFLCIFIQKSGQKLWI